MSLSWHHVSLKDIKKHLYPISRRNWQITVRPPRVQMGSQLIYWGYLPNHQWFAGWFHYWKVKLQSVLGIWNTVHSWHGEEGGWNLWEASSVNLLISKGGINSPLSFLWICFLLCCSVYSPSWLWTRILYRSLQPFCFKMGLVLVSPEETGSEVDHVFPLFSSGHFQCLWFSKCTTG